MKKIFLLIGFLLIGISVIHAQVQFRHEFSFHAGGGLSSLAYSSDLGSQSNGFGGKAGADYTLFLSPFFGVTVGVDAALYNSSFSGSYQFRYLIPSPPGFPGNFYLDADFKEYDESQQAVFLQIPLMIQFQTRRYGYWRIYGAIGGRIGIPLSASWKTTGRVVTTGYSDYTGNIYDENDNEAFGNLPINASGDLELNMALIGSIELGIKWPLTYTSNLYTGFYLDYAFNNVRKNAADKELIIYNPDNPSQYQYNSAIQSKYIDKEMIEKITPIAAGLKITLSFGAGEELKSPLLYEEKKPNKKRRFRRR